MFFTKKSLHFILNKVVEQVNAWISQEHERVKTTTAPNEAKTLAMKNLPAPEDISIEPFVTTLTGIYRALKKEVAVKLQGGIQNELGDVNSTTVEAKIDAKSQAKDDEKGRAQRCEVDRNRIHIESTASYLWHKIILAFIAIAECLWTISCFLHLGDIVIMSIAFGLGISIAQVYGIQTAAQHFKEIRDQQERRRYFLIVIIICLIVSAVLGGIRYYVVHAFADANVPFIVVNPFTFLVINMVFIGATAMIVYFYYPTKEELKKIDKWKALDAEIKQSLKNIKQIELELTELTTERDLLIEFRTMTAHAQEQLFEKIDAFYDEVIGIFKHENTAKRSDGKFPESFRNPHKPLSDFDKDIN